MQHIPILDAHLGQGLIVQQLFPRSAVVEFITQRLSVRRHLWKLHLFQQHRHQPVHRRIVRHLHRLTPVADRIPNFHGQQPHDYLSERKSRRLPLGYHISFFRR
jgi:hypothetical protein